MSDWQSNRGSQGPSANSGGIFAAVFLILFATPFAAFGLFALVSGIRKCAGGDLKNGIILSLFGLVFSAVGLGLMLASVFGRKKQRETAELQARFADRPWMRRPDWAAGKIRSSASAQSRVYLVLGLLFTGFGGIGAGALLPQELRQHHYPALIILVFPALGLVFLAAFFNAWRVRARFGDCCLELAQVPIPLGGTLEGLIQTGGRIVLQHGLHLRFTCVRRTVSGSGDNRSTTETVLWQDEKVLRADASLPEPEPGHTGIPVYFRVPADQPQCFSQGGTSIIWRLQADTKLSGPKFSAVFEVPVFEVAGAVSSDPGQADPTAALLMPMDEVRRDDHSRITVSDGPAGREFYFPPARNPGTAAVLTVFTAIWSVILWFLIHSRAPILFPIFWGITDVLLFAGCLSTWLKWSRVTVDSRRVRVVSGYGLFARSREYPAGSATRFDTSVGMTSGSRTFTDIRLIQDPAIDTAGALPATQVNPPLALALRLNQPRGMSVAGSISDFSEARWLTQEMNRALGRQ